MIKFNHRGQPRNQSLSSMIGGFGGRLRDFFVWITCHVPNAGDRGAGASTGGGTVHCMDGQGRAFFFGRDSPLYFESPLWEKDRICIWGFSESRGRPAM